MPILALGVTTAKLITSTQIITSVYTVVKELIENAFDADSDNIEINLLDNGTSLIEVKDNGCGISKDDALRMGLLSYTSKLSSFEDLDRLSTFGFRGEALNALCAVAEVTVITKTAEDVTASLYILNQDGQVVRHESCHGNIGTTVQARHLFKQIPVRRKLITDTKKANQTVKLLETLVQSFSICKPNVRIQFRVNNNIIFTKPSLKDIKEATSLVLNWRIMSNMEWVEPKNIEFILKLLLPSKQVQNLSEICFPGLSYIFVNDRPIKHKNLEKMIINSVLEYFEQESCRKKVAFLAYIILEPMDIDVNVEPNKDTILFKDENKVFDTIDECVRTFYGLKLARNIAENVSEDTSACYEDDTLNTSDNFLETDRSGCKKRKICGQNDIQESTNKQTIFKNKASQQQKINQIFKHQRKDVPIPTSRTESLNLSDSNDASSISTLFNNYRDEEHETLSQLPIVDLGEDFDFEEENLVTKISNNLTSENKDNSEEKGKEISLEAWSKGHVPGLKCGTDIVPAFPVEASDKEDNEILNSNTTHVDHKQLKFLKHVRSQVVKENSTLTAAQTAVKITEFWKKLSSEERGYYRDIAKEDEEEVEAEAEAAANEPHKKSMRKAEVSKIDAEKNKNRLLQMFEKMKGTKNVKKERLKLRTIMPWSIDRDRIITRADFEKSHIIGKLPFNLWAALICEQIWVVDVKSITKNSKIMDVDKIDAKRIEQLLKQWLLKNDDMSIMHSIYQFP